MKRPVLIVDRHPEPELLADLILLGRGHIAKQNILSIVSRQPSLRKPPQWEISGRKCIHQTLDPRGINPPGEVCGKPVPEDGTNGWLCWYHDRALHGTVAVARRERVAAIMSGRGVDVVEPLSPIEQLDADLAAEEAEVLAEMEEEG